MKKHYLAIASVVGVHVGLAGLVVVVMPGCQTTKEPGAAETAGPATVNPMAAAPQGSAVNGGVGSPGSNVGTSGLSDGRGSTTDGVSSVVAGQPGTTSGASGLGEPMRPPPSWNLNQSRPPVPLPGNEELVAGGSSGGATVRTTSPTASTSGGSRSGLNAVEVETEGAVVSASAGTARSTSAVPREPVLQPVRPVPLPTTPVVGGGASVSQSAGSSSYEVARGDTPSGIARSQGVTLQVLLDANNLTERSTIFPGDVLVIPAETRPGVDGGAAPRVAPAAVGSAAPGGVIRHTVERGDTLSGLASRYGVTMAAIRQANGLSSDVIRLDQVLVIPSSTAPVVGVASAEARPTGSEAGGALPAAPGTHRVVAGDTLERLARRYGTTIDALQTANGITNPRSLQIGQVLVIPVPGQELPAAAGTGASARTGAAMPAAGAPVPAGSAPRGDASGTGSAPTAPAPAGTSPQPPAPSAPRESDMMDLFDDLDNVEPTPVVPAG